MLSHYFDKMNSPYEDRYHKSIERIEQIAIETTGQGKYDAYFNRGSAKILMLADLLEKLSNAYFESLSFDELKGINHSLYEEVLGDNYELSYANPDKCAQDFGKDVGQKLCYIFTRIIDNVAFVFEGQKFRIAISNELFIKVYEAIRTEKNPLIEKLILEETMEAMAFKVEAAVLRKYDPNFEYYSAILISSDLKDLRYLFQYGLYIGENEIKTAQYLVTLPEEQIQRMADVFTEAFYKGYFIGNKTVPLKEKNSIHLAYPIGFERVVRKACQSFAVMGLKPIAYSDVFTAPRPRLSSTRPNEQFSYDHRFDEALYFKKEYTEAYEDAFSSTLEIYSAMLNKMAGIALLESFGNQPFSPISKLSALSYNDEQTNLKNEHTTVINKKLNQYFPGSAWSFVIMAYPLPSIGKQYEAIFEDVIEINALDSMVYDAVQKKIIDALDLGEYIHVRGKGDNKTDIMIKLHELVDTDEQTNFENCTADVNIPLGEVFTSPMLKGTTGMIHVSQVYLNNLKYVDLQISFKDGMIKGYTCSNFETEEENKKYVYENLMHPHQSLPLGEFAIGTNTKAYVMAKKYQIEHVLPILIAEKMGPHFAIGDTCYAWSEDIIVCNSDGKEIIAKENEKTVLRKTDLSQAYTYKHTDITIPYDELAHISAIKKDGTCVLIIKEGRFVLQGTELLNEAFNR